MRFKKRYLAIVLFLLVFGCSRLEILTFRKSDKKQRQELLESGQSEPTFHNYVFEGRNMHYTRVGNDSLPLVILVHGAPGSSSMFMDYLKDRKLTGVAQVVSVDRPGNGFSDFGKAERSLEKQAASLKEVLTRHRRERAILVGHSYGGPVIARVAMDFPEMVDGLVLVAGSIDPDLEPREWWRGPLDWALIRWLLPPSLRVCNQEIMPLFRELEKLLPLWEKITCPVTVIQGEKDKLVPKANADFAKKVLVNSDSLSIKIIEGGNHFILWSLKDSIVEEIIRLVKN